MNGYIKRDPYSQKAAEWFRDRRIVKMDDTYMRNEDELKRYLTYYKRDLNIMKFIFNDTDDLAILEGTDLLFEDESGNIRYLIGDPGEIVTVNLDTNEIYTI